MGALDSGCWRSRSTAASEFKATFEAACAELRIQLFMLPPRSPRLNGHVERAYRTHQEEFYDLYDIPERLGDHSALLQRSF